MTSKDCVSHSLVSLSGARAYIDTLRQESGSLVARELTEVLARLNGAYQEFPELEADRPRRELSERLLSAAREVPDREIIPLLTDLVSFDPTSLSCMTLLAEKLDNWQSLSQVLTSLNSIGFPWHVIERVVTILCQNRNEEIKFPLVAELLKHIAISEEGNAADFGNTLAFLLTEQPMGIDSGALARAAQSALRSPTRRDLNGDKHESREALLAIAERLRAAPSPHRPNPHPDLFWPSGRMSFDEFLMQWPCEVEVPTDLNNREFIDGAYQLILLREPTALEMSQYLRLLQEGAVSKSWILEDLLGSKEFRVFERRLRVIWGGDVITEPGRPEAEEMPTVTWRWPSPL